MHRQAGPASSHAAPASPARPGPIRTQGQRLRNPPPPQVPPSSGRGAAANCCAHPSLVLPIGSEYYMRLGAHLSRTRRARAMSRSSRIRVLIERSRVPDSRVRSRGVPTGSGLPSQLQRDRYAAPRTPADTPTRRSNRPATPRRTGSNPSTPDLTNLATVTDNHTVKTTPDARPCRHAGPNPHDLARSPCKAGPTREKDLRTSYLTAWPTQLCCSPHERTEAHLSGRNSRDYR